MRILYISMERGIELAEKHEVKYHDIDHPLSLEEIKDFNPDLILEREFNTGRHVYPELYEWAKKELPNTLQVEWFIDTHTMHDWHISYAKNFDVVFLAISKYVPEFKELLGEDRAFWLPLAWPGRTDAITPNNEPKDHEFTFVGRWKEGVQPWFPERGKYVDALQQALGDRFYAVTDYQNMLSILRRSKAAFNYCIKDDMNFRVFEALGAGVPLLTNDVPDLHLIDGLAAKVHIYNDLPDLLEYVQRLLGSDQEAIRQKALEYQLWVAERHSLVHTATLLY